jgi:probable HAF family extracellular repeat protein
MVLAIVRRVAPAALLLALIAWAGCTEEPVTGPVSPDGRVVLTAVEASISPTAINPPTGWEWSEALGVNDDGSVVVGSIRRGDGESEQHAFLWTEGDGIQDIHEVGWTSSAAHEVNDDGEIAGWGVDDGPLAVIWTATEEMASLDLPSGGSGSFGFSINNAGSVAGQAAVSGNYLGYLWEAPDYTPDILDDEELEFSQGLDINDAEETPVVVGSAEYFENPYYVISAVAWIPWDDEYPRRLSTSESEALGVNNDEVIVGYYEGADDFMPFRWTETSGLQPLETLGGAYGVAHAVNDNDWIVGESKTSMGDIHATLWVPNEDGFAVIDLEEDLDRAVSSHARDVSENGVVVGYSVMDDDSHVATVWEIELGEPPTQQDPIEELKGEITQLVDGGVLNEGQGISLMAKVESAERKYDQGRTNSAVRKLRAFINQVEDFVDTGVLTVEQGDDLIGLAEDTIDMFLKND